MPTFENELLSTTHDRQMSHGNTNRYTRRFTLCAVCFCALRVMASAQSPDWPETHVAGPFTIRADFALEGLDSLVAELREIDTTLKTHIGAPATSERIEVYVLHDKATFQRVLKRRFPTAPFRRALYIKQDDAPGIVLAYHQEEWRTDLRHECTHALLHASLRVVPIWLDEGLAEYFEISRANRMRSNPSLAAVRWSIRLRTLRSLEALESKTELRHMGQGEYQSSWAWTHFMLHGPELARSTLKSYIADLSRTPENGPLPRSIESRLNASFRNPRSSLASHFKDETKWRAMTPEKPK